CRRKPRGLCDGPVGQQSAAAAAGDAHLLVVDVATTNELIDTGHQILVVVAGILVLNDVAKVLTVAGAAARVRIEHDVTLRRHPLKLVIEDESVSRVWSTVDVENQRVLLVRIEIGWLLHPRLNLLSIEAGVPNFFGLRKIQL